MKILEVFLLYANLRCLCGHYRQSGDVSNFKIKGTNLISPCDISEIYILQHCGFMSKTVHVNLNSCLSQ